MSRKEDRRIDAKKDRAAVRQVLHGGHPIQPQHMNWTSKAEPVPVMDDTPRKASGRPKKGCPKRKGLKHVSVTKYETVGSGEWARTYARTVCKHCGKHRWGGRGNDWEEPVAPEPSRAAHWSHSNILARLGGGLCSCEDCMEKLDAETRP